MFLKKPKDSTDARVRSLLQKAARRGDLRVVELAARRVHAVGDKTWLRSRAIVITFEEAWPLAQFLVVDSDFASRLVAIKAVGSAVKNKDAAGLGALAWAFHENDSSMMDLVPSQWDLRVVAEALNRPPAFFDWADSQCEVDAQRRVVGAARRYLAAATWGWDKACILAGAFLATRGELPTCGPVVTEDAPFPFWVALDKHTPQGKEAIKLVSSELGTEYRKAIWAGFYFESARVNQMSEGPWWTAEKTWRLRKAGMSETEAERLWSSIRPVLRERLFDEASRLSSDVEAKGAGALLTP